LIFPPQAKTPVAGPTAGATLMPMVMKAQMTAAKAEAIWLRAVEFISVSFVVRLKRRVKRQGQRLEQRSCRR